MNLWISLFNGILEILCLNIFTYLTFKAFVYNDCTFQCKDTHLYIWLHLFLFSYFRRSHEYNYFKISNSSYILAVEKNLYVLLLSSDT